ncbi:MAG TPA: hypothetical protein VIZ58_02665, partial [Thermoanaerobaculia bacterium]
WNWKAVVATLVGCFLAWGGFLFPVLKPLYAYGWFVGFFASGLLYWVLSLKTEPEAASAPASSPMTTSSASAGPVAGDPGSGIGRRS